MKNARIKFTLGVVAVIVLVGAYWKHLTPSEPSSSRHVEPMAKASDRATVQPMQPATEQPANAANESASQLVAKMIKWRAITDNHASDQMEMELKAQITDANAGAIVRGLPQNLLQTPFGLMALERWSKLDRKAAIEWLGNRETTTPFQIATALHGWIARDSDAAHAYLESLSAGPWKEKILAEVTRDALQNQDPLEAITLLRDLPPGPAQADLAKAACSLWAEGDPAAAMAWAEKVKDPALKNQLLGKVAVGAAYSDPETAAGWVIECLPAGPDLNESVNSVVQVWVQEFDPKGAAAWVAQLPAGAVRQAALKGLISEWQHTDRTAFNQWTQASQSASLRAEVANQLAKVDAMGSLE